MRFGCGVGVDGMCCVMSCFVSVMMMMFIVSMCLLLFLMLVVVLLMIVLIRIVMNVFILMSLLLLISLCLLRCCGRYEYLMGLNSVECIFIMNVYRYSSVVLCVMKLVVLISISMILKVFMKCVRVVLLYLLVIWLDVVENSINGRMKIVEIRNVVVFVLMLENCVV